MNSKPKVLFLLHLPPPVHGSSIVGLNIKNSTVIIDNFKCSYINLLASKQVAQTGKVGPEKIFDFVIILLRVFLSIITNRPKLCYLALTSTGLAFYRDVLLVALLKLFRIKLVYHLHNKGVSLHQHKFINRLCYSFIFRDADVILLSRHLYSDIQRFVSKSKVHICPNGIKDETKDFGIRRQDYQPLYTIDDQEKNGEEITSILFLSNLLEAKGIFTLLEACALLQEKGILFKCILIGSEGDINTNQLFNRINQLKISNQIGYFGKRFGEEKSKAYIESDIFVFPTHFETFGLVNLEAMQYSLPIVSTLEGGIPDIIDDTITGFLIPKKNPVALAEKLELLIKNPDLRHKLGIAGRIKYEKEFTLDKFERTLVEILLQVIENE